MLDWKDRAVLVCGTACFLAAAPASFCLPIQPDPEVSFNLPTHSDWIALEVSPKSQWLNGMKL